jgi:hypothetical protein
MTRCGSITPFGSLVDPDVNWMMAMASESSVPPFEKGDLVAFAGDSITSDVRQKLSKKRRITEASGAMPHRKI